MKTSCNNFQRDGIPGTAIEMITAIVRALFLYHLAEYQSGNATTIKVNLQNHSFQISDNGRGHAIQRTINGLPYLQLVYTQLEYPFGLTTDTPVQLHTIGISLINSLCSELIVTVFKNEKVYIKSYRNGQLSKEETLETQEHLTGTTVEGRLDPDLFPGDVDSQDLEQWLKNIKSINRSLRLFYNERELA